MKKIIKQKNGFTLIEVIIYIALFSLLLGTAFVTAYQLILGSSSLNTKNTAVEEGHFFLRKIDWALTGVTSITTPSAGAPLSNSLTLTKSDGNIINIRLKNNKIEIKESTNGNIFIPITTANVSVNNLQFNYLTGTSSTSVGIVATATIDGIDFTTTKYIRQ